MDRFLNSCCAVLGATVMLLSLTGAAGAYSAEQEQMCTGDAMRLCGAYVPDVDRITACMIRQRSQLSPGCKVFFRGTEPRPAVTPVTVRTPRGIKARKVKAAGRKM